MSNYKGLEVYSGSSRLVLPTVKSDHSPLLISITKDHSGAKKRLFIFRYKAAWEIRQECADVVKKA